MNCKVCGSEKTNTWFNDVDYLTCLDCDCIFRSNPPENMSNMPNMPNDSLKQKLGVVLSKRFWSIVANQYLKYLKNKTGLKFKTVFDIGSAYGHFVKELNEHDIDATGIEKDQKFYAKRVTDKIRLGYFDESMNLDKKYDLISFTNMIYYLENPISSLNNAKHFLNSNGLIFIATYNVISPFFRKYPKIIEGGVNIMLSKKNFENLEGFDIVDFTNFKADILLERRKKSTMFSELKNYIWFHFKQSFTESEHGQQSFILLKVSD